MEFVKVEFKHCNHKVGINYWYIEFKTKYTYKMFAKFEYKNLIEACIHRVAHAVGYNQFSETEQYILKQAEHHATACVC